MKYDKYWLYNPKDGSKKEVPKELVKELLDAGMVAENEEGTFQITKKGIDYMEKSNEIQ